MIAIKQQLLSSELMSNSNEDSSVLVFDFQQKIMYQSFDLEYWSNNVRPVVCYLL